jgi:aspartyl-tRNA(Asn)/glutamyl-tRNA(Gln) amidotransferase subunit B
MRYEAVIGLEVHAQLLTESKIFCGCAVRFGEEPNSQSCPICSGLPGVLPVLNRRVVELAIKAGLATHCAIAPYARFARKNYFYPDLPKGYQISMYELPLCEKGYLEIAVNGEVRRIGLTRIHMEEDAGKNLHEGLGEASHVDLNRAGVPLLEIVGDPDLRSPDEAVAYLKKLREILIYTGVSDADMEKGNFRCDANVSLRPAGESRFGTKAEVKNMNSFRFVKRALEHEIERQERLLSQGKRVIQETRLFDPKEGVTASMRSKEEAHDYRYFPEPDLVPLQVDPAWIEEIRKSLPELPEAKRERFIREYGIPQYDAIVLTGSRGLADFFEQTVRVGASPKAASNWMMGDLLRELKAEGKEIEDSALRPDQLARMLRMIEEGTISGKIAKSVFEEVYRTGKDPDEIVREKGLVQLSDEAALVRIIEEVISANPKELEGYRAGKEKLFGFFVGQVMKASGGKANPAKVNELLKKSLIVKHISNHE